MKKLAILLTIIIAVAAVAFSAEYAEKGILEYGGTFSYASLSTSYKFAGTKVGDVTSTTMSLEPEVDYFVVDNISVGLMLDYETDTTKNTPAGGTSVTVNKPSTSMALVPNYIFKQSGNMYPFVGLILGTITASDDTAGKIDTSITLTGLRGGVKIKMSDSSFINVGLSYMMTSGTIKFGGFSTDLSGNNINLNAGITLFK